MKIAIFHNLPSGGGKRALFEWIRRLSNDHVIDVYSLESADHTFCDIRPFVSQHEIYEFAPRTLYKSPWGRLNQFMRWRDLVDLERLNRRIAAQINLGDYDILFANTCKYTFIPALLKYVRIPSVYYLHEPFGPRFFRSLERPDASKIRRRQALDRFDPLIRLYHHKLASIQTRSVRKATRLLANSKFTSQIIHKEFGVEAEFSPCGVDISSFQPTSTLPRENFVVSVGEMSPRKGFDFIVESLGTISTNDRPALKVACNIVQEDELSFVKNLAERKGVNLEVLVGLSILELNDLYNRSRLVVYAPVMEPFGLVTLEAMACGTSVVGVKEGGVQESVVHEKTGLLVTRDAHQFGAAIQYLLANPDLAAAYGRNGREHVVNNWTWERSVSILNSHLVNCVRWNN